MGRVVNIAHYALVNWDLVKNVKVDGYEWMNLNEAQR